MGTSEHSMQFAGGILGQHRHICAFFNSVEEEHRVLRSFIKDGFDGGERAFHIVDADQVKEHLSWLGETGINVERVMGTGQLRVCPWQEAYLREDRFDQDAMLAYIERALQSGAAGGYPLTRLLAHMEWALLDKQGAEDLIESLRLDFAFVRLCDPTRSAAVEVTRGDGWKEFPEWLQRHLAVVRWLSRREIVSDVGGREPSRGLVVPIGVNAEGGLIAAACNRSDFPAEVDLLLLSVAANHAATAFQSALAEQDLRQVRSELETKVAERTAELRRATTELQTILDASPVGIALFGRDQAIQRCNPAFERILGWKADEIAGHGVSLLGSAGDGTGDLAESIRGGSHVETRLVRKDGTEFDASVLCAPLRDEAGSPAGFVGTIEDVSKRKRFENEREGLLAGERAALAEAVAAQGRFRDLVNSVEGSVWEADVPSFQFSFVSKQAERILGYPVERWLSEPTFWADHLDPDDRERAVRFCETSVGQKRDHDFEYRMVAADGRAVWVRDLVTVVVQDDRPAGLRGG